MISTGKCPKCERTVRHLVAETPDVHVNLQAAYKGATFLCPSCRTILGAGIDPIALKASIISEIKKGR